MVTIDGEVDESWPSEGNNQQLEATQPEQSPKHCSKPEASQLLSDAASELCAAIRSSSLA